MKKETVDIAGTSVDVVDRAEICGVDIPVVDPEQLADALQGCEVRTPQFHREKGSIDPACAPDFDWLRGQPKTVWRELGMRPWGRREREDGTEYGPELWMFPGEWLRSIPRGLKVVDIFFDTEEFDPETTDDDIRFGCLAFGFEEKLSS